MPTRSEVVALDRRHVWRPYTSYDTHQQTDPLVVVHAEGAWLHDADGRKYLDANGSWWVQTVGHAHPRLRAVLAQRAASSTPLLHCSLAGVTHPDAALLAEELTQIAPRGLERVFFSDDGSTAVEVAIKIAFQYWQQNGRKARRRFVSLAGAYHGDTLGAVSLGGVEAFRSVFGPLLFDVIRAPQADDEAGWTRVVQAITDVLARDGDQIAGVIVEPVLQGAAGMRIWDALLLGAIRHATKRADTFLISDEVFTGYGRTGEMWATHLADDCEPDLLCVAKGFTSGVLPMAATLATARVYDGFRGGRDRALMHGHSFCGNPLGAAIAREVLAIYRDEDVIGQVRSKMPRVRAAFEAMRSLPGVLRTRSIGLVGAADLGTRGYGGEAGWRVYEAARQRGAYLRPLGDTVYIAPPLTIPDAELDQLLAIVAESIRAAGVA